MDVAYLQQTKCVFSFNPIRSSTHNRRVSVPSKVPIINSRDYQHNARRSFRRGSQNMCLASSSDTLVSGKSSSPTVTSKKETEFEEEEDLKSWMHKNGLPPCKVILKDRPAYDSRHPSIHYVAASEDLKAGDVAFSVPSSMLVTLERVLGNETVAELLTTSKLSELACLALYLMYEKNKEKSLSGTLT